MWLGDGYAGEHTLGIRLNSYGQSQASVRISNIGIIYEQKNCGGAHTLPPNQWQQISLPCDPGTNNTVAEIFGDDGLGVYATDWILWAYDPEINNYADIEPSSVLEQGRGYWVIQHTDSDKILDIPATSTLTPQSNLTGCFSSATGCFAIPLSTQEGAVEWNMAGYPFASAGGFDDTRVIASAANCETGCDLNTAESNSIVHNEMWTYIDEDYDKITSGGKLSPWSGYWSATIQSAHGTNPRLLVPTP